MSDMNRLSPLAAAQGFPEGEYERALDLLNPVNKGYFTPQPNDPSGPDFLRQAATTLPSALASLALCEYRGGAGEPADPHQAIADAREAAQQGDPDAILGLAVIAPPRLISLTETQAWKLFSTVTPAARLSCRFNGCELDEIDGSSVR